MQIFLNFNFKLKNENLNRNGKILKSPLLIRSSVYYLKFKIKK